MEEKLSQPADQQVNEYGIADLFNEFRMLSKTVLEMQAQISGLHRDMSVLYNRENIINVPPPLAPVNSSATLSNNMTKNIEGNNSVLVQDSEERGIEEFYEENDNEIDLSFNNNEDLINMSRLNAPNVTRRVPKDSGSQKQQKAR
jgi:hypothetical protein